jgi:hypothetical protein
MPQSDDNADGGAAGLAALAISESLLLALTEARLLSEQDARGVLEDAAATLQGAIGSKKAVAIQHDAAKLVRDVISGPLK